MFHQPAESHVTAAQLLHNNQNPILELPKTVQQQAAATFLARSSVANHVSGEGGGGGVYLLSCSQKHRGTRGYLFKGCISFLHLLWPCRFFAHDSCFPAHFFIMLLVLQSGISQNMLLSAKSTWRNPALAHILHPAVWQVSLGVSP